MRVYTDFRGSLCEEVMYTKSYGTVRMLSTHKRNQCRVTVQCGGKNSESHGDDTGNSSKQRILDVGVQSCTPRTQEEEEAGGFLPLQVQPQLPSKFHAR